jgi:cell division protein FtsI (penicillin-binding protein 3)
VTDPYEPGSTFKPFIWSVATELKKAYPDELLPLPEGPWRTPYGRTVHDAHYYGPSTWRKVLVKSMNAGMAMVAERMTHKEMQDAIHRFGFGEKTYCGLPGETAGLVTSPKIWKTYTQTSVAMGQEIAVTPLQMVHAFSAFARDGTMVPLRIVASDQTKSVQAQSLADGRKPIADTPRRALPERIVMIVREAMKGVMEEGTGRQAQSKYYEIFGKSGTAQLPKRGGHGYWEDRYVASFIAGAPYAEPRIVVLCVLDDPDKSKGHFGGAIAGPVVRDVIDDTLSYLGVPPDQPLEAETLVKAE